MEVNSHTSVQNNGLQRNTTSRKPNPPKNLLQELSIEKYRLEYLRKCRFVKRPPQSLRVSGCNALKNERISILSETETKTLNTAIKNKQHDIQNKTQIIHIRQAIPVQTYIV